MDRLEDLRQLQMSFDESDNWREFNEMIDRANEVGWNPDILRQMKNSASDNRIGDYYGLGRAIIGRGNTGRARPEDGSLIGAIYKAITHNSLNSDVERYFKNHGEAYERGVLYRSRNWGLWEQIKSKTGSFIYSVNHWGY